MTSKTIYVMEGVYRNKRIENTSFKLVKGYQPYPHKEGGFVTVHIDDMAKYQAPADKIRISVESESMLRDKAPEERAPESAPTQQSFCLVIETLGYLIKSQKEL